MEQRTRLILAGALLAGGFVAGCQSSAINRNAHSTFLTSDDLVKMTDQMAQSIIADPQIAQRAAAGPLRIVIKPVINQTDEIITQNRKELFVWRLQGLLAGNASLRDRFIWCLNRDDYEKLKNEEIPEEKLGPTEERIQPEYALYAKFITDTRATNQGRSDTYLCEYDLTRIDGPAGEILWSGFYETHKKIKKEFLD